MTRLKLYLSSATRRLDNRELADLLDLSRSRNLEAGVTGMLLHHDGDFLQVLEGEDEAVARTWERIARDRRHRGIIVMLDERRDERLFPDWSMGFRRTVAGERLPGWSDFLERRGDASSDRGDVALSLLRSFRESIRA